MNDKILLQEKNIAEITTAEAASGRGSVFGVSVCGSAE
jgi:hypothetical protein